MRSVRFMGVGLVYTFLAFAIEIAQNGFLSWPVLVLLISVLFTLTSFLAIRRFISELAVGLQIGKSDIKGSTVALVLKDARKTAAEVEATIHAIKDIGHESFPELVVNLENNRIKDSLLNTHERISHLRKKEQESNWITLGIAAISGIKHRGTEVTDYTLQVISTAVKYIKANQGSLFILRTDQREEYFELSASYAYGKRKYLDKRIHLGEGLVGQVYYEKDVILLTEVPKDYIKITSGLGEALPRCICIVPLLSEGKVYGAIEVASFEKLKPFEIEYLKNVGETVGENLMAVESRARTEKLLTESQHMAQEVKAQEEELRQNMEELTATQEQMQRKQTEMDSVLASLSAIELDMNGIIIEANPVFLGITGYEATALNRKAYVDLIPKQGNDRLQYEMMWASLLDGKTFSGEFRIVDSEGREVWMVGNFTPLLGLDGRPYKIMVISLFTTQDKEKLIELQEMVAALKNCFPIAEVNPDLTFKSANELFLNELGIKRIELKKLAFKDTFYNGSFQKVEKYFGSNVSEADNIEINLQCKNGEIRPFTATLTKVSSNDRLKKGIVILRKSEQ